MLVLDNIESVAQVRGNDASEEKSFDRLLSCLLTELDGLYSANDQVFVIGTTQDLRRLDSSVLRPGRLELHFPFSLPTPAVRREVLPAAVGGGALCGGARAGAGVAGAADLGLLVCGAEGIGDEGGDSQRAGAEGGEGVEGVVYACVVFLVCCLFGVFL